MSSVKLNYPEIHRGDHVDVYHERSIPDPYQWLENPDSEETIKWVEQQNKLFQSYISDNNNNDNDTSDSVNNTKEKLKTRLESLYNYERFSCPIHRGNKYFYFKNNGLQNQAVLYKQNSLKDKEEILLDPNLLSEDGTAALGSYAFSENGEYLAYGVSRSGSDWQTIEILNTDNIKLQSDEILQWVKFSSISWTHDHKGFFYSRYPTPKEFINNTEDKENKRGSETSKLEFQALYYHKLNTKQSEDLLVYNDDKNGQYMFHGEVSDDGKYLLVSTSESTDPVNKLYYFPLNNLSYDEQESINNSNKLVKLIDHFNHEYSYITNEDKIFYFKTNRDAPKYKIIKTEFNDSNDENKINNDNDNERWEEIISQHSTDVLSSVSIVNENILIIIYMHNAHEICHLYDLNTGKLSNEVKLPDIGSIASLSARKNDNFFFLQFTSFLHPGLILKIDLNNQNNKLSIESSTFRESTLSNYDPHKFQTQQIWFSSKDGTKIPMFIISSKNYSPNKSNNENNPPCYLYGYGGFNISLTPSFAVSRAFFLQYFNGIYVVANIRGGGELGEDWHKAGTKLKKQNGFDDFQAAAKYLIENNYTTPKKLIINGGSNGGLLVAACVNQTPELFGAAVAAVGVLDMLKFHQFTIGWAWKGDYGSSENKEEFEYLLNYSPLHTVKDNKPFPALLLTTGDHDDRVVPLHSLKYISEVQYKLAKKEFQTSPLLIRVETKAGHGAGAPLSKRIQEQVDVFIFISKALNIQPTGL